MKCSMQILVIAVLLTSVTGQELVITAQGRIRGEIREGFVSYRGIPYASINDAANRYKQAGLAPIWSGIRESQQIRCFLSSRLEDCLQLEVHVPTTGGAPWAVLVWVRGGSGLYNPGKLVQQGVIVVIVSHRLGPLGFLCMGEEEIPGNAGLKDVVLALRWVRDNISAFQGNPHKVVVAGQSFGAAMVEALTVSPMADGLFHGAIVQSGSVLCPWSFNYDAKERGQSLIYMINEENSDTSDFITAETNELEQNTRQLEFPYFPFGICVEKGFKYQERLFSEPPDRLLANNALRKVPMIIGYNTNEAYVFVSMLKHNEVLRKVRRDMSLLLPEELQFLNEIEIRQLVKQITDLYFKNNHTMAALLAFHSDAYFISHIYRGVRYHATSHHRIYFYQFSYTSERGVSSVPGINKTGAAHSDELAYLFAERANDLDGEDGVVQKHLLRLWTNFVKYLDPTPQQEPTHWEPLSQHDPRLLDISTELTMKSFPHQHTSQSWDDIYQRFYYARTSTSY